MSVIADDLEDGISSRNLEADVSLQTVQLMSRVRSRLPVKGLTRRVYGILCVIVIPVGLTVFSLMGNSSAILISLRSQ